MANKKTKNLTVTAILVAAYVVLSMLLKIPVAGTISLDLGYIALMVSCVCLGPGSGLVVGALGAAIESMIVSQKGFALGWVLMNAIIGYFCGRVLYKADEQEKKKFIIKAIIVVLLSALVGVAVKTLIDCALYNIAIVLKIPTGIVAWILDSIVMLLFGLPLSIALKKRTGKNGY